MKFEKCINNMSGKNELKRVAEAYVVDYKNLEINELKEALLKAAGQYFDKKNVELAMESMLLSEKRDDRIITRMMLKEVLLNKDDYKREKKIVDDEVLAYEQSIINASNEMSEKIMSEKNMSFFNFVLETAWESNNSISPDEKNMIEKIRKKLDITEKEYEMVEAKLGRFPKNNNELHLKSEIEDVRTILQRNGLLFLFKNSDGVAFDVIPEEIAVAINAYYGKEMRNHGYRQLVSYKLLKNKDYLLDILKRGNIKCDNNMKLGQLQELVLERVKPSVILGGYSPKDGLSKENLLQWCSELSLQTSGSKEDLIYKIIDYYNGIQEIKIDTADPREAFFGVFEQLAARELKFLRKQGIIDKDIDCEKRFEDATNYMFEKIFRQKPLELEGCDHPDGILSYNNKFIMWDNKSKEGPVKLKEFIPQFTGYVSSSARQVVVFMVIAPDFTDDSEAECAKFALSNDASILLVKAEDLKKLALEWKEKHGNDEAAFNLGYFKQSGKFRKEHIKI